MDLSGEYTIPAPRDKVWQGLVDPEILRQCISGCQEFTRESENSFTARVAAKVGPVKATFTGTVTLSDIDRPNGYTISGEGQGGVAGFAKGGAKVHLEDAEGGGTVLRYEAKAEVGGKLASVGSRLVAGVAKKTADEFFGTFSQLVGGEAAATAEAPAEVPPPAEEVAPAFSVPPLAWGVGLIVIVLILLYFFGDIGS